jgi:protein YIPF5/7
MTDWLTDSATSYYAPSDAHQYNRDGLGATLGGHGYSSGSYGMSGEGEEQVAGGGWLAATFGIGTSPGEGPLSEELGINLKHIRDKSLAVLHPMSQIDSHIMDDTDLWGPFLFCFTLALLLLFSGKSQFGYIFGVAFFGCLAIFFCLNLMATSGIDVWRTASVLGYCLLPMILLSSLTLFFSLKDSSWMGLILNFLIVLWCTLSSSNMFVAVLSMSNQRWLIAYPIALLYTCFALITVF